MHWSYQSTLFQHKRQFYTWTSPDGQYRNQTDFILCSQRWRISIVSKNKTGSWLWLRSWTPYCQIQTEIEENRENHSAIQVWPKSNPLQLQSGSDKQIQGIRSDRVPEGLWKKVHNIVQEVVIKTIPKKKNAKRLSEEGLQKEKKRQLKAKAKRKDIPIWMQNSKE